ncbi:MAG TPA: hypothetical protein VM925_08150 [Labilithrix sp.]|nr:hypothetical protein [Labilithrix sp.]
MKVGAALPLIGLGAAAAIFVTAQGCGDSSEAKADGSVGKQVPAEEGSPTSSTEERTFAVHTISLGEADRAGTKNTNAWKKFGFNLDKIVTNVTKQDSPDLAKVCKRAEKAPATVHQDGDEGIDNTFGKEIVPVLDQISPNPSKTLTSAVQAGGFTILLKVTGLDDDAAQTNTGLSGTLLVGAQFNADKNVKPTFTTADDWPYNREPQVPIAGGYVNKGVFVNGKGEASVTISLSISGQALSFTVNRAIISFKHNPGANALEEGTIAGVINTEEFVQAITSVAGRFDKSLCGGSDLVKDIQGRIREASDMLSDGTQDPSKTCDGISIGLGFTAKRVGTPTKAVDPTGPPDDPCADAGGGG